jgi:superfamily II DNA or RNA helicase
VDQGGGEIELLQEENARLKALLAEHGIECSRGEPDAIEVREESPKSGRETATLSTQEKIALFRRLFFGRQDMFARRWESSQGKSGYSPVCENEWREGVCEKPRVKCAACGRRKLLPLTDQVIFDHLAGVHVVGLYPLLDNDACRLLAADFDEGDWKEDAAAFKATCDELAVPCALEISRSSKGAHIWIFFATPVAASLARRLGAALISRTCAGRRQLELSSYDRLFPNQDRLPSGGFGNLIALPLQKKARDHGGSVFVDGDLVPFSDQWAYLSSLEPMKADAVVRIVASIVLDGDPLDVAFEYEEGDEPWKIKPLSGATVPGPLPASVDVVVADRIYIKKEDLPQPLLNRVIRLAAFPNPEFYKAQALRLPVWDKPRVIGCAENFPRHIALPRGCRDALAGLLAANRIALNIKDERFDGRSIHAVFVGTLRLDQDAAIEALLKHDIGVLRAPTAFGKTVVAAAMIARRKVNTLVLVHRTELLLQWRERLGQFLELEQGAIGLIGGGKRKATGIVDIAVMQSLSRREDLPDFLSAYGQVIVDECHHISAVSFEELLRQVKARYVLGLTATPIRRDGLDPIIFMQCGPIRHAAAILAMKPGAMEVRALHIKKGASPSELGIQSVFGLLAADEARNQLILRDVEEAWSEGRKILVLTERSEHLDALFALITPLDPEAFVLHGRMTRKKRNEMLSRLNAVPEGKPRIVVATGRLIGEGFDHPSLDTLVLALPISWKGTLQQYAGRLNRTSEGKTDLRIYDYVEIDDPRLSRMWAKRERGYRAMGYTIRRRE